MTKYKHPTCTRIGTIEYDTLNPPETKVLSLEDGVYLRQINSEEWIWVGHIPAPKTRLGWFVYHMVHGLAMRYRILPVIVYSFREAFGNGCEI